MFFLKVDGTYWIALKPILDAMSIWGENYKENYYQD